MEITFEQLEHLAEQAAEKAVLKYKAEQSPLMFRTKTSVARYLKCDRRTIDAMIARDEVVITKEGRYKLNSIKCK